MLFSVLVNAGAPEPEIVGTVTKEDSSPQGDYSGDPNVDLSSIDIQSGDIAVLTFGASNWAAPANYDVSGWTVVDESEITESGNTIGATGVYYKTLAGTETTVTVTTTGESTPNNWTIACTVVRFVKGTPTSDTSTNGVSVEKGDMVIFARSGVESNGVSSISIPNGYTGVADVETPNAEEVSIDFGDGAEDYGCRSRLAYKVATSSGTEPEEPPFGSIPQGFVVQMDGYA